MYKACGSNTGETSIKYAHDGMNAVLEFDSDMNLQYKYIYANGMLLGRVDASDQKAYYHHDGLGSTIGITDVTPSVTKSYLYDEFGTAIGIWGDAVNSYKYTGQEAEGGPTDGYNLRAREYYPKLGRFMQNDPIGDKVGSANWYGYVGNNPVNWTDIKGLVCGSVGNDLAIPDNYELFDFTYACLIHDRCYGTCGASKSQCDREFLNNMLLQCQLYQSSSSMYSICEITAGIYYLAVHFGGGKAFQNAQCNCQ